MKKIIILFIVFGCVLFPKAQDLENLGKYQLCTNCPGNTSDPNKSYSYGIINPMKVSDIGDNYDRRVPGSGSLWHLGWDLNFGSNANSDEGAILFSPFDAEVDILDIYNNTPSKTGLTVITIGKQNEYAYYYMHGFVDDMDATNDDDMACRSGKLVLFQPKISNPKEAFCIINTQDSKAWCEKSYSASTVTFDSKSYNVTSKLKKGDPIFPVGGSGKYPIHLHVGAVKNGKIGSGEYWNNEAIAPVISQAPPVNQNLKGLGKATQNNPNVNIFNSLDNPWVSIRYPGYKPTSIKARINIDGENNSKHPYNKVAIVDQIQFLVTPKSDPLVNKLIIGKSLNGEINIGSNKTRYPESIKDNIGKHYNGNNDGVTGMESFAYNNSTGAHPWDDYYFSDFAPRKFKNFESNDIADFSNDAQYPDGEYNLAVCAYEAGDTKIFHCSDVYPFAIDNFLPFIEEVKVNSFLNGLKANSQIYQRELISENPLIQTADDGEIITGTRHINNDFDGINTYIVEAKTSEPMKSLECEFKNIANYKATGKPDASKMNWIFDFPQKNLPEGDYTLKFTGKDLSGNELLKINELANYTADNTFIPFPSRKSLTGSSNYEKWNNSNSVKLGSDEFHVVKIKKGCGIYFKGANEVRGGDCFSAVFKFKVLPDGISVQFTNQSEGNPSSYIWDFGDGASSTEENPTHEYYGTGKYKVKLTAYLNGETDEVEHIVDLSLLAQNGNFVVNIIGSSSVGLGSVQNYMSEVVGGYPPYSYNWDVNKDFSLSTCPGFYSVRYTDEFEVEFTSPGCNLGNEGQISLEVTDAEGNVAIGTLDVSIIGESPECKIVYSGELKPNKFVNLKIEKKDFLFGANCKTYYTFFDWEISGPGYYDDSNKNISYWLPYEFPKNGVYTVTAKGKLGMYDWPLDEYVTTIIINDGIPPAPPNPPFSFYPSNTINVDFGESLSANKNNNFFMGLLYKNPLDQDNNTTCNEKTFDATGYRYDISIKTPGTGNFYQAAFGLNDFGSKGGDVIGNIFAFHDPGAINSDPVNLTINQDFYGCNDITIEVYPQGLTCDASIINCENGQKSACTTNLINDPKAYIWSECLTCPKPPFASGTFENYKYSLPIKIEKKCAFKFDPPQLIVNPAVVNTMDCGQTYLQAVVEGGATFTTGNNTPGGFPCAGSPQAYKTYEWSCFTMDGTIPIDVLKKGNSQCVEVNYDSKYFDTFWNETEVSFKVILKVWDRLDDYAIREFYVTVNKPMRLEIPTERNVCGGSSIVFNNGFPLLSGGSGDFTYFWDKTQYFNDNFNASSPSPQLDLPDLPNGSVIYTLLVTDNISGCTLSKKITINFGSIIVNAGPDIITCIGQSLKKLGLLENEVMVSGGDGNYTYAWNSSIGFDNLSDPQSLRPTVSAVDNIPVSYYLEVHDGSGCYATDEVVVTGGHDLNFKAEAGLDQTVCYGSNVQILGKSFSGVTYKWKVSPTQTLKTDNEAELSLTESFTTNPGTYILNYTMADDIGCYSQDEMMLTVANQWKYIGFEPGISYINPHPPLNSVGRIFDKVKPDLTKLPKIYTVTDNNGSGALSPFIYSWLEPGVESKITQNSKVISQDGYLQEANIVNPPESGYTMKVTDALGCTMNFHTNYFLLHGGQKSLVVTSLSGDYYLCNEAKLQFKVIYKTGYTGMLPTKLPQKLSVKFDVQNWLKTNQTGDFGQFYQQGEVSTALLTLTNSKEGIYEGIITLNKNFYSFNEYYSDCGYQATHFYKMYVTGTDPILNTSVVKFDVYNSSNIPTINCLSTTTITGPCSIPRRVWGRNLVSIGYASTCNAGSLRVINGGQCDVRVGSAFTDPEGIYLRNIIEVEEGSYFHAYIEPLCSGQAYKPIKDPVIVDEPYPLSNDVPQVYHKDGLLFPNPTKGLIYLKQNYGETRSSLIIAICVYDVMGQKLIKSTKSYDWSQPIEFDVSTLKSGAYFIEINSSLGEVFRFNFIKIDN